MLKDKLASIKSSKKMNNLKKELTNSPNNVPNDGSYLVWKNNELGSDSNINLYNLWIGTDITKKEKQDKKDILLLLPNSVMFNKAKNPKISNSSELDKIILNKDNWKPMYLSSRVNSAKDHLSLDKKNEIKSSFDYFQYLVSKKKMNDNRFRKSSKIIKAVKDIAKDKNQSISNKLKSAKKEIKHIIKDAKLFSLQKDLFKNRTNKESSELACVYYNTIFNSLVNTQKLISSSCWYDEGQATLVFPHPNGKFLKMFDRRTSSLKKYALDKKYWKEIDVKKEDLEEYLKDNDKKITSLAEFTRIWKNSANSNSPASSSSTQKTNQSKSEPLQQSDHTNDKKGKDKQQLEDERKPVIKELKERQRKEKSKQSHENEMNTLIKELINRAKTHGPDEDTRVFCINEKLKDMRNGGNNNYVWYATYANGKNLFEMDAAAAQKHIVLVLPQPKECCSTAKNSKELVKILFDSSNWLSIDYFKEECDQNFKQILDNDVNSRLKNLDEYIDIYEKETTKK